MTDTELLQFANDYFNVHLDKAYWTSLDEDTRLASLLMARNLLKCSYIPEGDICMQAYCEQAVFMVRNHSKHTDGKVVTSQSLDSLSQSFTLLNADNPSIAPMAAILIKRAKKSAPRTIRTKRG